MASGGISVFRMLKPYCTALNDAILRFQRSDADSDDVLTALQRLSSVLETLASPSSPLDSRLCDYAFFPVSLIFRERGRLPVGHLEIAVQCLDILLRTGWRQLAEPAVATQLLILLTFLAEECKEQQPQDVRLKTSEELRQLALLCMLSLFESVAKSAPCAEAMLDTSNIPAVGHAVSVLVDGMKCSDRPSIMLAASKTLQVFLIKVATPEVIQSFLPGIVSVISQIAATSVTKRPSYKTLRVLLQIFSHTTKIVLSDTRVATLTDHEHGGNPENQSWLEATTPQMNLALANIVRLRSHSRIEVREELRALCWLVLVDCRSSLSQSAQMMLETLVILNQHQEDHSSPFSLEKLLMLEPSIAEDARSVLYDWIMALSRIMTSNDEDLKADHLQKITSVYGLLVENEVDLSLIDDQLVSNLTESLFQSTRVGNLIKPPSISDPITQLDDNSGALQSHNEFPDPLVRSEQSVKLLKEVRALTRQLSSSKNSVTMMRRLLDSAQFGVQESQVVNFWTCLSLARARDSDDNNLNDFLDLGPDYVADKSFDQELYSFALDILTQTDRPVEVDWRMQALALEAIARQAGREKQAFRIELVDALYPIIQLVGSSIEPLRNHAIVCLNLVARSCNYANAQDLLVSNVDYLVNAISLKLNNFDLSPQAPQVLLMMIKLCGPKLLPYLEDLVDSVFDSLECFHGYPQLVELLFSVLNGFVEEGAKASRLSIEPESASHTISHQKQPYTALTIEQTITNIAQRRSRAKLPSTSQELTSGNILDDTLPDETPRAPWSTLRQKPSKTSLSDVEDGESQDDDSSKEITKTPPSKTTQLLIRITTLTQHHLPTPSPTTRSLILSLLTRCLPILSQDEDTFLPLVHTLWPVLVPRLSDPQSYVVSGVLDVMSHICIGAGDFVTGRIEGIWPRLKTLWDEVRYDDHASSNTQLSVLGKRSRAGNDRGKGTVFLILNTPTPSSSVSANTSTSAISPTASRPYEKTTTLQIRNAFISFLINLVRNVHLPTRIIRDITDDMLLHELIIDKRSDVRSALEVVDREGVWLLLERARWNLEAERGKDSNGKVATGADRMQLWRDRRPRDIDGVGFANVEAS